MEEKINMLNIITKVVDTGTILYRGTIDIVKTGGYYKPNKGVAKALFT